MSLIRLTTKKRRSRQFIATAETAFRQQIALFEECKGLDCTPAPPVDPGPEIERVK